jgi:release factor glutamine methyltransferase
MTTLASFKKEAIEILSAYSASARLDVDYLLSEYTNIALSQLALHSELQLTTAQLQKLNQAIKKRSLGEPIAYIIGHWGFWKYDFLVNKHTLIPRPDTEILIEQILDIFSNEIPLKVLDLGTGTGIIPICLAKERDNWDFTALDISANALEIAKKNAAKHKTHINFYQSDWFDSLPNEDFFDLIISNPPYIKKSSVYLKEQSIKFEPQSALIGGEIGTEMLEKIIYQASARLYPQGYLILESASWQTNFIKQHMELAKLQYIGAIKDYGNNFRVSIGRLS